MPSCRGALEALPGALFWCLFFFLGGGRGGGFSGFESSSSLNPVLRDNPGKKSIQTQALNRKRSNP